MYISELKMHGFKSFANKEVMKLGQGITTVVGPNGCGKTNIVDAIRWVLGEQKYRVLRSGKMEDVIFNGADGLKPLGVCEVSMTVHNNAGKLPIEYNDIEIARRVYRSGESEYYLNKTQCRLKDIMDLFVDTGMGADAYSVIELKMIEQILSETADDRRKMFEEAAGIHKYRTQRKSTIRKFEVTRADLERVQDIITEVEQKVHHLGLQLKRFKRHNTLIQILEEKDIDLAFLQIHRNESISAPLRTRIEEYKHLRESKTSEFSAHQGELEQFRSNYKEQEKELSEMQSFMSGMNTDREDLRNKILVWAEQGRGALLTVDRLEREHSTNFQKIQSLKQLSLDFDKEMSNLEPVIEDQLKTYKSEKEKFEFIEKNYQQTVQELDNKQNERWDLQRKLSDDRSLYERTRALVDDKQSLVDKLTNRIKGLKELKQKDIFKNKQLSSNKKTAGEKLADAQSELVKIESALKSYKERQHKFSEKRHQVSAEIKSLIGQKAFYHELVETKEGFPDGTRFVLENPKLFPGVLGTVADMFQIDESNRDALESGLGDLSHCLIAKDKKSALKTMEVARKNQAGDFTVIPLKEAKSLKVSLEKLPKSKNIIGRASELVSTSKGLGVLADYLLGNLLIVDDLKSAIASSDLDGWGLVDQSGSYSGSDLILKNRQISEHGNIIGRQKKLDSISVELTAMLAKENGIKSELVTIDKDIHSLEDGLKSQLTNIKKLSQDVLHLETEELRLQFNSNQIDDSIITATEELDETKQILSDSQKALKSLEPAMGKAKKSLDSFQKKVDDANEMMLTARKEREKFQQKLQDTRIRLIELETHRDQVKFKKSSGKETQAELVNRQDIIKNEISDLKRQNTKLDKQVKEGEKSLKTLNAKIQKQRSILDLKQSVYRGTFQQIEAVQAKIAAEQRDREQILEDLKNAELEASETDQMIRLIRERIRDRYNKQVPKNLVIDETEEQLEIQINKIQRSIENIGPVNMAVQAEYEEENERLEVLSVQRDDLIEAEENLRETIRKIDKVARKRFSETFDLIKTNFEQLFHLFFEGGNATLKLVGDPDPLEADIAIEAQPPGKRNTSLRLLSSGEKALTAISLLFAIYQVKPSPYCILDEVDAPLDDVNIHKFTRVLAKFCDETQFIIVTHNKLTMEIADFMYGVTQEKKGVSQLVSVKFH